MSLYVTAPPCVAEEKLATAKGWDRDFLEDNPDLINRRLFLAILVSIDDRLIGYFSFRNLSVGPTLLHGVRTSDEDFCPMVRTQVSNTLDGNWMTIPSNADGKANTSIIVEPNATAKLMVKMDPFVPFLNKFKFGRATLENGEVAWFELKDLLPPNNRK